MAGVSTLLFALAATWSRGLPQEKKEQQKKPSYAVLAPMVLVDVSVRDSKDKHVRDLRPEEFELYENGARQQIDSIEIRDAGELRMLKAPEGGSGQPGQPDSPAGARAATSEVPRVNIITFLMDFSSTEFTNQKYVRDAAVKYVKQNIGPNDLVAVYATGSGDMQALQPFTADKDLLANSLSKADLSGSSHKGDKAQIDATIKREHQTGSAASGFSPTLGGGDDYVPGAPLYASGGTAFDSGQLRSMLGQRMENSFTAVRAFTDTMLARPVLSAIKSLALAEQDIPGRKTLILFSEGFAVPSVQDVMRDAVDAANKANLVVYAVDVKGLLGSAGSMRGQLDSISAGAMGNANGASTASDSPATAGGPGAAGAGPANPNPANVGVSGARASSSEGRSLFDRAREVGSDQEESALRFLSSQTGGFLTRNTNDFVSALQRIDDDIRTYYLLSYRPSDQAFDGRFREIKVDVTRPGVKVRARSGYYATPPTDKLLTPDQRALFTAAREEKTPAKLTVLAEADELFPSGRAPAAVVTADIGADGLQFKENGPFFETSLQIMGLVSTESGRSVTTFGRALPLRFDKSQLDAARGGYISHSESVTLYPGRYSLELLVYEPSTGNRGYFRHELDVEPPSAFTVSDLILSHQVTKAAPEVKNDPLVVGEAVVVPSGSRQFRNGERLIFYFDLYNAKAVDSRVNVEVTLALKRDGKPLAAKLPVYKVTNPLAAGVARVQVAKYLELAGLPAGQYSLAVTAADLNAPGAAGSSESTFAVVQ